MSPLPPPNPLTIKEHLPRVKAATAHTYDYILLKQLCGSNSIPSTSLPAYKPEHIFDIKDTGLRLIISRDKLPDIKLDPGEEFLLHVSAYITDQNKAKAYLTAGFGTMTLTLQSIVQKLMPKVKPKLFHMHLSHDGTMMHLLYHDPGMVENIEEADRTQPGNWAISLYESGTIVVSRGDLDLPNYGIGYSTETMEEGEMGKLRLAVAKDLEQWLLGNTPEMPATLVGAVARGVEEALVYRGLSIQARGPMYDASGNGSLNWRTKTDADSMQARSHLIHCLIKGERP